MQLSQNEKIGFAIGAIVVLLCGTAIGWIAMSGKYSEGLTAGKETGNTSGYAAGFNTGNASGYNAGFTAGNASGYNAGNASGHKTGYDAGFTAGNKSGYGLGTTTSRGDRKTIEPPVDASEFPEFGLKTAELIGNGTGFTWASVEGRKSGGDLFFSIPSESTYNDLVEGAKLRDNGDNRASQLLSSIEAEGYLMFRNGNMYQPVYWSADTPTEIEFATPFDGTDLPSNYDYDEA